jgi:p-aminobenzoyl-glutamate transporter AbgT
VISNQQTWFDIDPAFFKEFRRRRSHLRCTTRLILKDSEAARLSQSQQHLYNESIRLLKTQAPFNHGIVVVPHLAFFVQTIVPYGGVIIENRHLVDTLRGVFEILWAQLET